MQAETWRVRTGTVVWVRENPSVLAAAVGTGVALVCVEGRPSVAAEVLLESLVAGGGRVRYHGDFGAGGIAIANEVIGRLGAHPWRFGADDHAVALDRARSAGTALRPLRGPVPDATWDERLSPAIRAAGLEVEEALVTDVLLADLG